MNRGKELPMSKSSRYVMAALVAMAANAGPLHAQTHHAPGVEAEIETTYVTTGGKTITTPGHYYRGRNGRTREDSPVGSMIVDPRTGTVTLLNPATKEAKVIVAAGQPRAAATGAFVPFEQATLDGHPVKKARTSGAAGQAQEMWTAEDIGLVVLSKVEWPDFSMTKVLRNISVHEPQAELFQVPSGYHVTHETARPAPPAPIRAQR
jgi:hypothetical protein